MTQQKAGYPVDYSIGSVDAGKEYFFAKWLTLPLTRGASPKAPMKLPARSASKARKYSQKAQKVIRNFKPSVDKSMKEQPWLH